MQVVIAGGGVAGLTAALALARQGHQVQVVDRDDSPRPADVAAAAAWPRRGVARAGGRVLPAALVVDATGPRGRVSRPWLQEVVDSPADEVYTSRRYRLR